MIIDGTKAIQEIRSWYFDMDKETKQKVNSDPCVIDSMISMFITTLKKYEIKKDDKKIIKHCKTCACFPRCSWDGKYIGTSNCADYVEKREKYEDNLF